MKVNKIHVTIMAVVAVLMLSPCLAHAQDTSRNFVRTVTMLDAGGTDSLQAVQYYNAWDTCFLTGGNREKAYRPTSIGFLLEPAMRNRGDAYDKTIL